MKHSEAVDLKRRVVAESRANVILCLFALRLLKSKKMNYRRLDYTRAPKRVRMDKETQAYFQELAGPNKFLPKEWTLSKWDRTVYNRIVTVYQNLAASSRDSVFWRMFENAIAFGRDMLGAKGSATNRNTSWGGRTPA
jgi:hypothetical protein